MAPEPVACPQCGGGIAMAIFADENGSSHKCFNCGYGFTKPADDDHVAGTLEPTSVTRSSETKGVPGLGSVNVDGSPAIGPHGSGSGSGGDGTQGAQADANAGPGAASVLTKKRSK